MLSSKRCAFSRRLSPAASISQKESERSFIKVMKDKTRSKSRRKGVHKVDERPNGFKKRRKGVHKVDERPNGVEKEEKGRSFGI